jgi:hypothetical protein
MFTWVKRQAGVSVAVGPFAANVVPKGDGRWRWEAYADGAEAPQASGIGSSAGAAKTAVEQLIKRSGRV